MRSLVLTPKESAVRLDVRGFHEKDPEARELLETVGRTFLSGYAAATAASSPVEAAARLDRIPVRFRGFAYEGAAMGLAVMDGLPAGGNGRVEAFLAGPGDPHAYMAYVGVGWAMARLPRFRWRALHAPDPLLRWLALDGYGFHQAYFRTERYVRQQYRDAAFPWPDRKLSGYAARAIDQGIGRALWFVCGTDAELAASTIEGFAPARHPDLWSGVGLAATYAGGAAEKELTVLKDRAGTHRRWLAQGSAFAAEARLRAGLLVPHVEPAVRVLCDSTPQAAALVCAERLPDDPDRVDDGPDGPVPAFETWRDRIAGEFA
ncbi:DUF1702 family protein [Actinomadura rupiterrae]|uniref:DUF1702 family protein n=1 Tax=Actinomadura rupiterrae TaxID=559627 RepID=UPI0020A3B71B|nr:DUF1702 family protein [Actinomadura rupiterrae]MCP2336067.1 hypothetical protein [Actinomadura rupiterrae]